MNGLRPWWLESPAAVARAERSSLHATSEKGGAEHKSEEEETYEDA